MIEDLVLARPPDVRIQRDPFGDGWLTLRRGRPGYLLAPHHSAHCPCGQRRLPESPLCFDCHVSIFEVAP